MEYRPGCDRGLVSASAAHQKASRGGPTAAGRTLGATEPGRPPQPRQVGTACAFCGKALLELGEGPHAVLHGVTPITPGVYWSQVHTLLREENTQDSVECQAPGARGYLWVQQLTQLFVLVHSEVHSNDLATAGLDNQSSINLHVRVAGGPTSPPYSPERDS